MAYFFYIYFVSSFFIKIYIFIKLFMVLGNYIDFYRQIWLFRLLNDSLVILIILMDSWAILNSLACLLINVIWNGNDLFEFNILFLIDITLFYSSLEIILNGKIFNFRKTLKWRMWCSYIPRNRNYVSVVC